MSADHARDSWILRVSGKAHERLPKRRNGPAAVTGGGCPKTLKEPALASAILVEAMASKYAMNPSLLMWTLARPGRTYSAFRRCLGCRSDCRTASCFLVMEL